MDQLSVKLKEFRNVFDTLVKDIERICSRSKSLAQTKKRSLVRAFFALIEFDTYKRKQITLLLYKQGYYLLDEAELLLLKEEQCDLDSKGNVRRQKKFLRLADNYKFGIKMFCKATDINYHIPVNCTGWQSFLESIAIRNRITHPKGKKDIDISDEELSKVINAYKWFMDNSRNISAGLTSVLSGFGKAADFEW